MHWIVPFAAPLGDDGRAATARLALPRLAAWLARAAETGRDPGDAMSFSTPQERVHARALGWSHGDGRLPWAARALDAPGDLAWGLATPAHWHLGADQVSLVDPDELRLGADESRAVFDVVAPLFTSEGFAVRWSAPLVWHIAHASLSSLRTASLDRVVGRNVDVWLDVGQPAARLVRRLQNEVQMLLYTHPINDDRATRGLLAVNSFWLSGCGVAQPAAAVDIVVDDRLRGPALATNWTAWDRAWQALDGAIGATPPRRLTLCGERAAVTFDAGASGAWQRLRALVQAPAPAAVLATL